MTCQQCESSKQRQHSGAYSFKCVECCARLVLSAHPDKRQASAMLAAIDGVLRYILTGMDRDTADRLLEDIILGWG